MVRIHMHDWLILILLAIIEIGLNVIHPFYRFVGKDMMTDLKYPLKESTVPLWAVPVSLFFFFSYILNKSVRIVIMLFSFTDLRGVVAHSCFSLHLYQEERCV